jgi:hypothetical protein
VLTVLVVYSPSRLVVIVTKHTHLLLVVLEGLVLGVVRVGNSVFLTIHHFRYLVTFSTNYGLFSVVDGML